MVKTSPGQDPFGMEGDSGAAVMDENGTAVGMLFARGFDALCRTYVMPVEMLEHMTAVLAADSPSACGLGVGSLSPIFISALLP